MNFGIKIKITEILGDCHYQIKGLNLVKFVFYQNNSKF